MIVEMRTYTAHPGKAAAWLDHYQKNGLPVQRELLGKLIFFGTTEIGPLHQIVHLWAYESLADREQAKASSAPCIAVLSYVFDYATRDLAQRLTRLQHEHHDLFAASTRVPLDHTSCLEIAALRGPAQSVQHVADEIATQRGVRHASLNVVPVRMTDHPHRHESGGTPHQHMQA